MKKLALLITIFLSILTCHAQQQKTYTYYDIKFKVPHNYAEIINGDFNSKKNNDGLQSFLSYIATANATQVDSVLGIIKKYIKNSFSEPVIFIKNPVNSKKVEIPDSLVSTLLYHKRFSNGWSQYVLGAKSALVVFIKSTTTKTLDSASIKVIKQQNRLTSTFRDLTKVIKFATAVAVNKVTNGEKEKTDDYITVNLRLVEITSDGNFQAPCLIKVVYPKAPKNFEIINHEKSYLSFQVGIAASNIQQQSLSLDKNQNITVSLNQTQQTAWKSNLIGMIVYNPSGQDADGMGPFWKRSQLDSTYNNPFQRFGVFFGLKISSDPIQSMYGGLNFTVSKDFYVNIGGSLINQLKTTTTPSIGNITSVAGLDSYLARQYKRAFFVGVSFTPAQLLSYINPPKSTASK